MATTSSAERVGRTLRGKWQLDALVGVGGMASVYAATHRNGGRAAIKVLHPELADMSEVRARFVREGYLANRVGHPAVVRAIDDDIDDDGTPFLVMELVDGETLAERTEEEPLEAAELLAVAAQVLPALVAGHSRGVIHQDLKPENLLVDGDGCVRVLDYGIARAIDDRSDALKIRSSGTPSFMSPEQVLGSEEIGPLSDLYSLGATLFALATGRPPHLASTPMHLLVKITTERAPRVATLAPELPQPIAALIDRALAREPERRWPSAAEMLREVERVRDALQISSSPLVLACRHGVTQPDVPMETTGSVRAMIVSHSPAAPLRRSLPTSRTAILAAALVAGTAIGVLAAKARRPPQPSPVLAAAAAAPEPPRELAPSPTPSVVASVVTVEVPVLPPSASIPPPPPPPRLPPPTKKKKAEPPIVVLPDYKESPY